MNSIVKKVGSISLDIEFESFVERDPLGTGDSPMSCEVDIISVSVNGVDIQNIVSDVVLEQLEDEIASDEVKRWKGGE